MLLKWMKHFVVKENITRDEAAAIEVSGCLVESQDRQEGASCDFALKTNEQKSLSGPLSKLTWCQEPPCTRMAGELTDGSPSLVTPTAGSTTTFTMYNQTTQHYTPTLWRVCGGSSSRGCHRQEGTTWTSMSGSSFGSKKRNMKASIHSGLWSVLWRRIIASRP